MIYTRVARKWVAAVTSPLDRLSVDYRCHVNDGLSSVAADSVHGGCE